MTSPVPGHDFLDLQKKTWVYQPTVGNTDQKPGGAGTCTFALNSDGSQTITFTPGVGPGGTGYDNAFCTVRGVFTPKLGMITRVVDNCIFRVSDITKIQAIELDLSRNYPGRTIDLASCVDPVEKRYCYFNYDGVNSNGTWVPIPSIPYDPTIFKSPLTMTAEYLIDEDAQTKTHVSLAINGKVYPVGFKQQFSLNPNVKNPRFDVNFQLGSTSIPKGQKVPPAFSVQVIQRSVHVDFPQWSV